MDTTLTSQDRSLLADRRGAVLLVAVFMSAFLVGALWYAIGIGDAAIYRQYMQDGADAVAFGSAVYHARGMNIIALINMVMAAVLMVLIAFKIANLLLIAANIASCIVGAWLNPVCDLTTAARPPFAKLVDAVEKVVDKVLRGLYQASNAVAYGMPWVAEGKALASASDYKPTVDGGFMASISLVPGSIESAAGGFVSATKTGSATGTGDTKKSSGPNRLGLPVQDDKFSVLCDHAGRYLGEFIFAPFSFLPGIGGLAGAVGKFAGGLVGTLVSTFPGYFCGEGGGTAGGFADTIKKGALGKADAKVKDLCKDKAAKAKKEKVTFDVDKCLKAGETGFDALGSSAGKTDGDSKTCKRVYEPALLGDDYFAVWSFTWGDLAEQSGAPRGVNVAGWNKAYAAGPDVWSKMGIAKAEFYYEPKPGDPKQWSKSLGDTLPMGLGGAKEGGLVVEAMWNMRWRARLRRLRLPMPTAGGILASKLNSKFTKVPVIGDLLKWPAAKVGEIVDDKVGGLIGSLTSGTIVH
ncbi:MAG: hypothetical protein IPJ34_08605 [Myxococcales bacterium]|nr:hypothetical protein [Myxococcales bacterium]